MIDELRQLTFSTAELTAALQSYLRKRALMLPDAYIASVEVSPAEALSVTVRFRAGHGVEPRQLEIAAPQLAAAMIECCIQSRIPVPRSARKHIERAGDGIALCFAIHTPRSRR